MDVVLRCRLINEFGKVNACQAAAVAAAAAAATTGLIVPFEFPVNWLPECPVAAVGSLLMISIPWNELRTKLFACCCSDSGIVPGARVSRMRELIDGATGDGETRE